MCGEYGRELASIHTHAVHAAFSTSHNIIYLPSVKQITRLRLHNTVKIKPGVGITNCCAPSPLGKYGRIRS